MLGWSIFNTLIHVSSFSWWIYEELQPDFCGGSSSFLDCSLIPNICMPILAGKSLSNLKVQVFKFHFSFFYFMHRLSRADENTFHQPCSCHWLKFDGDPSEQLGSPQYNSKVSQCHQLENRHGCSSCSE